ncbi:MAG: hypothetical protein CFE24_13055 [Flavobacterium sp. BFFFF2]|nr:MAG: hypothetical protein CFE24_13055 [Flavobacterium sp. BFFFF2]
MLNYLIFWVDGLFLYSGQVIALPRFFFGLFLFTCLSGYSQTNIYFEVGSDQVDAKGKEAIKKLVANFSGKEIAFTVKGYTDTTGIAVHNFTLARKREKAVVNLLTSYGLQQELIGFSCTNNISNNEISNAENRRVSITVHEMASYLAKNGSIILAPKDIKLKVIDHFYQPDLISNWYKNKKCRSPMPKGEWRYADVEIQSKEDSCRFILVKIPKMQTGLPLLFTGRVNYGNINWKSYADNFSSNSDFGWYRIPIYSDYIALNQYVLCGYNPSVFLHIAVPNVIRPLKASLVSECITIPAGCEKDTVTLNYSSYAPIDWSALNLKIKTRDTVFQVPMSEFEVVSKINYSDGLYILRHRGNWQGFFKPKEDIPEKRRTFWQRVLDLFR